MSWPARLHMAVHRLLFTPLVSLVLRYSLVLSFILVFTVTTGACRPKNEPAPFNRLRQLVDLPALAHADLTNAGRHSAGSEAAPEASIKAPDCCRRLARQLKGNRSIHQADFTCDGSTLFTLRDRQTATRGLAGLKQTTIYGWASLTKAVSAALLRLFAPAYSRRPAVQLLLRHQAGLTGNHTALSDPKLYRNIRGNEPYLQSKLNLLRAEFRSLQALPALAAEGRSAGMNYSDASIMAAVFLSSIDIPALTRDWFEQRGLQAGYLPDLHDRQQFFAPGTRPGHTWTFQKNGRKVISRHTASGLFGDINALYEAADLLHASLANEGFWSAAVNRAPNRWIMRHSLPALQACPAGPGAQTGRYRTCLKQLLTFLEGTFRGYGEGLDVYLPGYRLISARIYRQGLESARAGDFKEAWQVLVKALDSDHVADGGAGPMLVGHHGSLDGFESQLLLLVASGRLISRFAYLGSGYGLSMDKDLQPAHPTQTKQAASDPPGQLVKQCLAGR